jgi:hypothetical protein
MNSPSRSYLDRSSVGDTHECAAKRIEGDAWHTGKPHLFVFVELIAFAMDGISPPASYFLSSGFLVGPCRAVAGHFPFGDSPSRYPCDRRRLVAADGQSRISTEDFAIALVDELEQPKHSRQRFTVGY